MTNEQLIITPVEEKALQLMEPGARITDAQLQELEHDDSLLAACLDLQAAALAVLPEADEAETSRQLQRFHDRQRSRAHTLPLRRWWWAAAAAVLLLLCGGGYLYLHRTAADTATAYVTVIESDNSRPGVLLQAQGQPARTLPSTHTRLSTPDVLDATTIPAESVTLTVPQGKTYKVLLADGTEVYMNPDSRLVFPSAFTGSERVVTLEGEAFFRVRKDHGRPFIVRTPRMTTTVLGTEFNVCSYADTPPTVTLISGSVRVSDAAATQSALIVPGQQATLSDNGIGVSVADIDPYVYRMQGYFYFDQTTLADIMRCIGRWYNLSVEFHNRAALGYKMRFIAEQAATPDTVLDRINRLEKVTVRQDGDKLIVE